MVPFCHSNQNDSFEPGTVRSGSSLVLSRGPESPSRNRSKYMRGSCSVRDFYPLKIVHSSLMDRMNKLNSHKNVRATVS